MNVPGDYDQHEVGQNEELALSRLFELNVVLGSPIVPGHGNIHAMPVLRSLRQEDRLQGQSGLCSKILPQNTKLQEPEWWCL